MGSCMCESRIVRDQNKSTGTRLEGDPKENADEGLPQTNKENVGVTKTSRKSEDQRSLTNISYLFVTCEQLTDSNVRNDQQSKNSNDEVMSVKLVNKSSEVASMLTSQKSVESSILKKAEERQHIDGAYVQKRQSSKMSLSLDQMDIEFNLPNRRAGPIVVPFINYDDYTR